MQPVKRDPQAHQKIVDRALTIAHEVGLEGLSLGILAADLKRSKSGLFAHFRSKEELQLAVLREIVARFTKTVIVPALGQPRGAPRLRKLFEGYLGWIRGHERKGGCMLMALSQEFDDRPGAVRDLLVQRLGDWQKTIARVARTAVEEKYFRRDLDAQQFAYEMMGIAMAFQHTNKLLGDAGAGRRARQAFEELLARSRSRVPNSIRRKNSLKAA
jgi:AcrR family transcriptional regulator